ncbi:siderophore (surfactin) biosynthesis regulatory protein [Formosa agariphila KMM 3901]|uniref:Siderophore (Surfactin) biosynthesis regulatory protein n=1 Tax=Formosa agariphila (strain DSM 15362 / KCTC 12365 / LMG 23005 / KMM 3901 / M-2Alg 35-1) TaxID=1347342 RepID=T2KS43_FORAG|nr:4'-phosphopantetheinyl transferase superfamily protein [Formosa agariphila]CDF80939.1 siderophore (surfactin) biosynthesis regulatory protein [Formosa agariphila KMM 3901]
MPVYKTLQPNSQTTVKIWKITESYDELFQAVKLKPESLTRVLGMKSELHQRGFLSVRCLLAELGYSDFDLYYDQNGKPHLKDGRHISITHSFTFSGVVISDKKTGIDIEKNREKVKLIAHKFSNYEFCYLSEDEIDYVKKLTVIWGAKEALYKLYATPGLSFYNHILVIPFDLNEGQTTAWIDYKDSKNRFDIYFLEFEDFTCVYTVT